MGRSRHRGVRRGRRSRLGCRSFVLETTMSFIDWSDPEEMFGLLVEFVSDERNQETQDLARRAFLSQLLVNLSAHLEQFGSLPHVERMRLLRDVQQSIDLEFTGDPVVEHLIACGNELERIGGPAEMKASNCDAG